MSDDCEPHLQFIFKVSDDVFFVTDKNALFSDSLFTYIEENEAAKTSRFLKT